MSLKIRHKILRSCKKTPSTMRQHCRRMTQPLLEELRLCYMMSRFLQPWTARIHVYPHAFLKKRRGYCNRLRPSVRPSRYLLLNHWTKSNQIWCVCCSHEWGVQRHIFFWPRPLGPWGGAKRSNIIKYH